MRPAAIYRHSLRSFKDDLSGSLALSQPGIQNLVGFAKKGNAGPVGYWQEVARFLQYTKKLENITPEETAWLADAVTSSGSELTWQEIAGQLP